MESSSERQSMEELEKQLISGSYKNSQEFNANQENLRSIIRYLAKAVPRLQVLDVVLGLLKFFRFPLALCCAHLYRTLNNTPQNQLELLKDRLLEIAAYVRSLVAEMGIEIFAEIEFFFRWGHAKKKFKVSVVQAEKQFGQFILSLSNQKKELAKLINSHLSPETREERINAFLSSNFANANVFEEASVDHMKNSCSETISSLLAEHDEPKSEKLVKRGEPKSVEKREESEKPKRSESSSVLHNETINQADFPSLTRPPQSESIISKISEDKSVCPAVQGGAEGKGLCCRTFFVRNEIIEQPENLRIEYKYYAFPFYDNSGEVPGKREKIKRTLCGFLNSEGGTIYFGIKELPETRRRIINGMILSERSKKKFSQEIARLCKDVLPEVGKKYHIAYVPVKDSPPRTNYITGCYIAKVIVERGSPLHVYSYRHETYNNYNMEKFTFRTENEVLEITEAQKVLKIFKNKIQTPPRIYYPTHPQPCPEPESGKPLYEDYDGYDDEYEYDQREEERRRGRQQSEKERKREEYRPILAELQREPSTWQEEEEQARKKKYMQKGTKQFLIHMDKCDLDIFLKREFISYNQIVPVGDLQQWTFLELERTADYSKLIMVRGEVVEVYPRISYEQLSNEQVELMDTIILEYRNNWNVITRETKDDILHFNSPLAASVFYLKMLEMGLKIKFTPLI